MVDAGILDGDYVVVKQQNTAANGDIVVALIEDEATVKTFYKEKNHYRLQPQNDAYEPIIVTENLSIRKSSHCSESSNNWVKHKRIEG